MLAEKPFGPDQEPSDFTVGHITVAQGRRVFQPPLGPAFMLRKIDHQPFCQLPQAGMRST
jgi:hypothetical protein